MRFYLGTDRPGWLGRTAHPLFISRRTLARVRNPGPALGHWALDSGGFTEIARHGRWETEPARYADEAWHWMAHMGGLDWAAIQDWMCEPAMLARTGKSVREHQELSVASYLTLRDMSPGVPWAPVLQGYEPDDYLRCADLYAAAGVDLASPLVPTVGVGTLCRRQATRQVEGILRALLPLRLTLHAFGLKIGFFRLHTELGIASFDSMAWSYAARKRGVKLPTCTHPGRTCSHCFDWAMRWRDQVLRVGEAPRQMVFIGV
jgi:hypothetical protein